MVIKNVKRTALALCAGLSAISLFACSSTKPKEVTKIESIDPYKQESVSMGDKITDKIEVEVKAESTTAKIEETVIKSNTPAPLTESERKAEADFIAQIEQEKRERTANLYRTRNNITDEEIDQIPLPDYIAANGLTNERAFHKYLKKYDYLWEYMADPVNYKVDYSLSDKEFIQKYGDPKTNGNGQTIHIEGLPYTFDSDGFPVEHPNTGGEKIVNPINGKTYIYNDT